MRETLAEFFGTTILITFGLGVVAQTVLSGNTAGSPLGIHLCWGFAVILGVYASAGVSGAHLNPAVTLARAASDTFAGIRPSDAPGFIAAQLAGAVAATATFRWLIPPVPSVSDEELS